jgi:hypothetical protein
MNFLGLTLTLPVLPALDGLILKRIRIRIRSLTLMHQMQSQRSMMRPALDGPRHAVLQAVPLPVHSLAQSEKHQLLQCQKHQLLQCHMRLCCKLLSANGDYHRVLTRLI